MSSSQDNLIVFEHTPDFELDRPSIDLLKYYFLPASEQWNLPILKLNQSLRLWPISPIHTSMLAKRPLPATIVVWHQINRTVGNRRYSLLKAGRPLFYLR